MPLRSARSISVAVHHATVPLIVLYLCQTVAAAPFVPPQPLRIGVGGDYADGLDGMLIERGLPHERIFPWELSDPEVLKRFDLLFLSCPTPLGAKLDQVLETWVKAGGRAYIEVPRNQKGPGLLPKYVTIVEAAPKPSDAIVGEPAHALVAGLASGAPIELYDLAGVLLRPQQGVEAQVITRFCPDKGGAPTQGGAAMLTMALGQGELVCSGSPLAFCCFRGEATQPLLGAVISYLIRDRGRPRLTAVAPESAAPSPTSETSENAPIEAVVAPPTGYEPVDCMAEYPYNVLGTLGPASASSGPESLLLLDGRPGLGGKSSRPGLWLAFGAKHVQLRAGSAEGTAAVAAAAWQPPMEPIELLVRRRPGLVSVVLGDREVLRAPAKAELGGLVALKAGLVPLADAFCQEVGEPVLFDNFMREPDDPSEWTTVSGRWTTVGVGNEKHSINGFFVRGESGETGLTATGDWFWEDYTVSAAVRPESAAACGLGALRQPNGDMLAFVADTTPRPWPTLRLVRVVDGREMVLAQRTGGLAPQQWHRLALRVHGDKLEGLVDGEALVECANPEVRGGGIGIVVKGGAARFDDVLVRSAAEPLELPGGEGTPAPEVPLYVGAEDHLTWANPAVFWVASATRPSLLWHRGDFAGDMSVCLELKPETETSVRRVILAPSEASPEAEWLSITARTTPGSATASLELALPGKRPVEKQAALGSGQVLQVERKAGGVRVLWGDTVLSEVRSPFLLRRLGLEIDGPPLAAQSMQVSSPDMRDYVFGAAPTDWWSSAGTWEVAARWSCDTRWSFFAGWGEDDAAVWHKRLFEGDVVVEYYVGVKMDAPGGSETQRCRDLNTVLCGDKSNVRSGYSFILGGDGGVKTQLLRKGIPVAESASIRVPPGSGVHQEWYHIRAARIGSRVELDFEGRPIFRWEDPDPLPGGHVGIWTRNSGVVVSRVTIFG